jgi:uncharacterized protein (DUF2147 family)
MVDMIRRLDSPTAGEAGVVLSENDGIVLNPQKLDYVAALAFVLSCRRRSCCSRRHLTICAATGEAEKVLEERVHAYPRSTRLNGRGRRTFDMTLCRLLFVAVACTGISAGMVLAAPIDGTWLVANRMATTLFPYESSVCGRVVWVRNPALRTPDIRGRTIVWGLTSDGPSKWVNGWVFDPEDGRTYHLSATQQSDDTIHARVYAGWRIFGKTEILRRIANRSLVGCGGDTGSIVRRRIAHRRRWRNDRGAVPESS